MSADTQEFQSAVASIRHWGVMLSSQCSKESPCSPVKPWHLSKAEVNDFPVHIGSSVDDNVFSQVAILQLLVMCAWVDDGWSGHLFWASV